MAIAGPQIEIDWELGVFRALRALWRAVVPAAAPPYDVLRAARWVDHAATFRTFVHLIAGAPIPMHESMALGGVRGRELLVPGWIDLGPDPEVNRAVYLVRLAVDATRIKLGVRATGDDAVDFLAGLASTRAAVDRLAAELPRFGPAWAEAVRLELALHADTGKLVGRDALEDAAVVAMLAGRSPGEEADLVERLRAAPRRGPPRPPVRLFGRLIAGPGEASDTSPPPDGAVAAPPASDATEAAAVHVEELRLVQLPDKKPIELPTHSFEKVETAEAFNGTMRELDGEDDLDEHLEALKEADLSHLVRGGPQAHSVYKAEVALDADVPDVAHIAPGEHAILYDEWDARRRVWRKDWCAVYPTAIPGGDPRWATAALSRHRRTVDRLYRQLVVHRTALRPVGRQLDGEDVDVPAVVDALAERAAGREGSPRLYVRQARQRRDVATLVLLDVSLSTDGWIADRRVLDVAREAVLVLGEVADRLGDRLRVLAFASHTHNQVRVWEVRSWNEPWAVGKARLGRLDAQGYTRIGPALRHATAELRRTNAMHRVLLVVTDGKPTDYDKYEGRYGMGDVRRALTDARGEGVHVHALAIDAFARDTLPALFGVGAWSILPHPDRLPEALTKVYGRLT